MINMIQNEFLKLKRISIFYAILITSAAIPIILSFGLAMSGMSDMEVNFNLVEFVMFILLSIIIFSVLTAYIFSREFSENTSRVLFTYPVKRIKIYLAKVITIYIIMFLVYFIQFSSTVCISLINNLDNSVVDIIIKHGKIFLISLLMHYLLVPIAILLVLISKNIIIALLYSVIFSGANFIFYVFNSSKFILPTALPAYPLYLDNGYSYGNVVLIECILLFVVGNLLAISYLNYMDVS